MEPDLPAIDTIERIGDDIRDEPGRFLAEVATMFAPLIAKPQAKTAGQSSDKSALRRATAYDHDRDIEQSQTSRSVLETAPRFPGNEPPGGAWDFSKLPLNPPGRTSGSERPSPAPVPRLPGPIQRKLKVGAVDDPLEHEADRVADQVVRMPAPEVAMTPAPPSVSRKCDACEEGEKLQKKEAGPQAAAGEAPASVHAVLRSPGQPLDAATRAYFEPRFGRDFSGVRVHTAAAQSARDVNAHAYTVGYNIAFDTGRFAPGSQEGRRLIAHELAHVVQQGQGKPLLQRQPRREPKPMWVSPSSREDQPAKPVYNIAVNPNNLDWRGQNRTLQEALDKAFEKVCYDDNGVSTGITRDQLHESAWVKTSYGKTVPVEWKGPRSAEVSIDVAHTPPSPDIAHVNWQRPGKSEGGHIFLDETPYGRAPLKVPEGKFPTPPRSSGGGTIEGAAEALLTEKAIEQKVAQSGVRSRAVMGKIVTVGGRAFALLKVGGYLYVIYSLTQIRSVTDAIKFGEGLAVNFIAVPLAAEAAGAGELAFPIGFLLIMPSDQAAPSEEKIKELMVDEFLRENFTREEVENNWILLHAQAKTLLFYTKPFEIVSNSDTASNAPEASNAPDEVMSFVHTEAAAIRTHLISQGDKRAGTGVITDILTTVEKTTDPAKALKAVRECFRFLDKTSYYPYDQLWSMQDRLLSIVGE
jgi:hypothetical protein